MWVKSMAKEGMGLSRGGADLCVCGCSLGGALRWQGGQALSSLVKVRAKEPGLETKKCWLKKERVRPFWWW